MKTTELCGSCRYGYGDTDDDGEFIVTCELPLPRWIEPSCTQDIIDAQVAYVKAGKPITFCRAYEEDKISS